MKTSVWILLSFVAFHCKTQGVRSQRHRVEDACKDRSCYPEIGDLLIGREGKLTTNSTCGLDKTEKYCIVSHLEEIKKCFTCDSRQEYDPQYRSTWMSHRLQNIVSTFRRDWKKRWWQAQNGIENVYLQLDLEAEFRFTHLSMRFKTFRPRAMFIERSYDFGNMWYIYRYYAYDCQREFPGVPTGMITNISDVICESQYSDLVPSTEGEVVFRAVPPSIDIEDPYSQEVQHLIKITNLRIVFKRLHTLGDDQLGSRIDVDQKYYYSMYDMVVRGSCNCYGHASKCKPMEGQQPRRYMVFGVCECKHNTKGVNCEQCEALYNDLPWRPALDTENACRECNCNSHSKQCHFDAAVYEATGQVSGGVCDDCQHNTHGRNCEECLPGFYSDPSLSLTDPNICKPCPCDLASSTGDRDDGTGRCICRLEYTGSNCDSCLTGYYGWPICQPCDCFSNGTLNGTCQAREAQCPCKPQYAGQYCNQCAAKYYDFPNCRHMAVNQWKWIMFGVSGLLIIVLVMVIGYYYKKYRQNLPSKAQQQQLTEMTDNHMGSSRVYEEISQNIPAQIQAPRPPARRPDQTMTEDDTGIYLTQAGTDTSLLRRDNITKGGYSETLHIGASDRMNDENMTADGYLQANIHVEPVGKTQHREEEQKNECNAEYETYDPEDHTSQIPQKTTDGEFQENAPEEDADYPMYQAMTPHPPVDGFSNFKHVEYQKLKK